MLPSAGILSKLQQVLGLLAELDHQKPYGILKFLSGGESTETKSLAVSSSFESGSEERNPKRGTKQERFAYSRSTGTLAAGKTSAVLTVGHT
jgi:hypothetical protein